MNSVCVVGNVAFDPEVRYSDKGTAIANLRLCVPNSGSKGEGWYNVVLWGKTAETAASYVKKGSRIGVTGSLKYETWQDSNTNQKREKVLINGDRIDFLSSKSTVEDSDTTYSDEF